MEYRTPWQSYTLWVLDPSMLMIIMLLFLAPSGPPTGVRASPTSARSISMSWGPPIRNQQNGIIRHYLISLQSLAGTVTRNISSTQQSISISGLRPYTMYNCTVQAETVGLGPPNAIIQISTPQDGKTCDN